MGIHNMSNILYISDCFYPESNGGAELVDETIINYIGKDKITKIKSNEIEIFPKDKKIIVSNISLMNLYNIRKLEQHPNYIIVEHDYKIHHSRWPWMFKDSIIPVESRINYNLYKNAKAVFVQTTDHLNVFKANEVEANFINLGCSIWSRDELITLNQSREYHEKFNYKMAILDSKNWIKNTKGAIQFCEENQLDYDLIPTKPWDQLMNSLAWHSTLVFFPIARESCCRLVVEARCLDINVITTKNYGAVLEPWFKLHGQELTDYLSINSKLNLEKIKECL
jgi:hypothetical protein